MIAVFAAAIFGFFVTYASANDRCLLKRADETFGTYQIYGSDETQWRISCNREVADWIIANTDYEKVGPLCKQVLQELDLRVVSFVQPVKKRDEHGFVLILVGSRYATMALNIDSRAAAEAATIGYKDEDEKPLGRLTPVVRNTCAGEHAYVVSLCRSDGSEKYLAGTFLRYLSELAKEGCLAAVRHEEPPATPGMNASATLVLKHGDDEPIEIGRGINSLHEANEKAQEGLQMGAHNKYTAVGPVCVLDTNTYVQPVKKVKDKGSVLLLEGNKYIGMVFGKFDTSAAAENAVGALWDRRWRGYYPLAEPLKYVEVGPSETDFVQLVNRKAGTHSPQEKAVSEILHDFLVGYLRLQ